MTVRRINFVSAAVSFQISILTSYQGYNSFLAAATAYMLRARNPISPPQSTPFFELMDLLDVSNINRHSPDSTSSKSLLPTPSAEVASSRASATNAAYVIEQVYKILFVDAEDSPSKWEFLKTKAPLPVSKLVENKAIVELLLATEPGPKVDYDDELSRNLALLKPYVINTPS